MAVLESVYAFAIDKVIMDATYMYTMNRAACMCGGGVVFVDLSGVFFFKYPTKLRDDFFNLNV